MDRGLITRVAGGGVNVVRFNLPLVLRLGRIPLVLAMAANLASQVSNYLAEEALRGSGAGPASALVFGALASLGLLLAIAFAGTAVPFATALHRFTLSVAEGRASSPGLSWARPEWRYLSYALAFAVAWSAGLFIGAALSVALVLVHPVLAGVAALLLALALFYAMVRFSFVFPAIAVGEKTGPRVAFRQTAALHVEVFLAMLMVMIPFIAANLLLGWVVVLLPDLAVAVLAGLAVGVVEFAALAVYVAAISLAWRRATGFHIRP